MDLSLLHRITGNHFSPSPAVLKDFQKFSSRLGYPHILPRKGSTVEGLLIRGLDPESIRKLDRYEAEGHLYFRQKLTVVSQEKRARCEVYVKNPRRLRPRP